MFVQAAGLRAGEAETVTRCLSKWGSGSAITRRKERARGASLARQSAASRMKSDTRSQHLPPLQTLSPIQQEEGWTPFLPTPPQSCVLTLYLFASGTGGPTNMHISPWARPAQQLTFHAGPEPPAKAGCALTLEWGGPSPRASVWLYQGPAPLKRWLTHREKAVFCQSRGGALEENLLPP